MRNLLVTQLLIEWPAHCSMKGQSVRVGSRSLESAEVDDKAVAVIVAAGHVDDC